LDVVKSVGIESPLLSLLSYLFPFRNTRQSMHWGNRCEHR